MAFYDRAHRGDVVQRVIDDVGGFAAGLKLMLRQPPRRACSAWSFGVVVLAGLSADA